MYIYLYIKFLNSLFYLYTLKKNNTFSLCILCMLVSQIMHLFTLMLVCMWSEWKVWGSIPKHTPLNYRCLFEMSHQFRSAFLVLVSCCFHVFYQTTNDLICNKHALRCCFTFELDYSMCNPKQVSRKLEELEKHVSFFHR